MATDKFCVVIPIYRDLVLSEKIALEQMHKVLKKKDNVYAMCPEHLDISKHKEVFPELVEDRFDEKWFKSTTTYSQLLLKPWFYEHFSEKYEYMLILQLDVWLTRDDISEWCDKGYEYIGGPIMVPTARWHNYYVNHDGIPIVTPKVGNGGFSLRKLDTFILLTDPDGEVRKRYGITDDVVSKVEFEDLWLIDELGKYYDIYKPRYDEAIKFAIDMNPDLIYGQYGFKGLPTGIHAFDKNIPFWKDRIPELSSQELYDFCYGAHKEFIDAYYNRK